jgi:hypothetical protein
MEGHEDQGARPPRKVVTLRPRAPAPEGGRGAQARPDARKLWSRRQALARWIDAFWVLLASALAASRTWDALERHEVFGLEASVAFVLLVSIPIIRGRALFSALALTPRTLRRWMRARKQPKA